MSKVLLSGRRLAKCLLVGFFAVVSMAVNAENERLEDIRSAISQLVELGGASALEPVAGNDGVFITLGKVGPYASDDPAQLKEDPEIADDARVVPIVDAGVQKPTMKLAAALPAMGMLTINRLNPSIAMDPSCVALSGTPGHYICHGSSGTLTSTLVPGGDVVSIDFEVARGAAWLTLSQSSVDEAGHKVVTYTAQSNVGGASRYGLVKCHERYWVGQQLVELCTWYPVGQCGDWLRDSKKKQVYSQNYSVLCYDWAADSGNGTGMKAIPIQEVNGFNIAKLTITHTTENAKLVTEKTNKSKKQTEYTYFANMSSSVKSCLTTTKIKGFTGQLRTWNFFAPKPAELLEQPMDFTATDNLVTNVLCSWSAVADATSYKVFRNGVLLGTTSETFFNDGTGTPGKSYTYAVVAEVAESNYVFGTSPSASDTGKSVALTLKGIRITTCPAEVYAGMNYPGALACTATFNDGLSKTIKPTWSVTKGKATVTSAGGLRTSPRATGSIGIKASYTFAKKTCTASATIKVVPRPKPVELKVKEFFIHGPDSIPSGDTSNYWGYVVWTDNVTNYVENAEWTQLTGSEAAAMSVEQPRMSLTALYTDCIRGTLVKATWGDYTAVKRVEIVPPDSETYAAPVLCADGELVGVVHTLFTLPIRVDSAKPVTVTVKGLPKTLGLTYDAKKRVITGTPAKAGTYKITVSAKGVNGRAQNLVLSIKILALPGWAKGVFSGIAEYDLYTDAETQFCPYGPASASLSASGKCSVKFAFSDDTETFAVSRYNSATIIDGKVTALQLKGTLKTATGKRTAYGEVTSKSLRLWSVGTQQAYAEMYRQISPKVKSEKKLIQYVAKRTYKFNSPLKLKLTVDKNGQAKLTGKIPGGRKVSVSAKPSIKDGNVYYRFVFTPTGKGGNGFWVYLTNEGTSLNYWYLTF